MSNIDSLNRAESVKIYLADREIDYAPTKLICLLKNYKKHAEEFGENVSFSPEFFFKPPSSLISNNSTILIPKELGTVHHEVELAIIIKKQGRNISVKDAEKYILGYTVFLDITARDLQQYAKKHGLPWSLAKGIDTFGPVGPVIATGIDPSDLEIELKVNTELRQRSRTSNMIFSVPEIISELSKYITLMPMDLIATGTPEGVNSLKDGDVIEAEIEKIGILRERVKLI